MNTKQALVTCGGKGLRLKTAGMEFPLSKSFIEFEDHPMIYWSLLGLYHAGIERLVIIGNSAEKLKRVEEMLSDFPYDFSQVDFHKDSGLGTSGLPYQARHFLDDYFFFELGHSMSEPEHYNRLEDELKDADSIVFSGFKPNPYSPRLCIRVNDLKITLISSLTGADNEFSVCSPGLLSQRYISNLPRLDFNFNKIINFYASNNLLGVVYSHLPIEVDVVEEWREAVPSYKSHIRKLHVLA